MTYFFIAFMWAGYCALHSYLISIGFTNRMNRLLGKYYAFYRLFYILISLLLLIPLIIYSNQLDSVVIIGEGPILDILRDVITTGSLLMFAWAFIFDYDFLTFFGVRQILRFGRIKGTNPPGELKRRGLLGIIRHPLYFALIIYLWCQTRKLSDLVVNIVLTLYIIIGTRLEEKKLLQEFGESYISYQKEVPMIIPFTKVKMK